jgi:2-polyprenyl-3-methyl-5-hydroxy-6-metoxy-1,4-benzoquinol methylase
MTEERPLPDAETYHREIHYMPWEHTIESVGLVAESHLVRESSVIDLMCGPFPYLLERFSRKTKNLTGVDINGEFIGSTEDHPFYKGRFNLIHADVLEWVPPQRYDVVTCTAGLHHIPWDKQERFIQWVAGCVMKRDGLVVFADPYLSNYGGEKERKLASEELGSAYLREVLRRDAPDEIIQATIDIMHNDILGYEYKTSVERITPVFGRYFNSVRVEKNWGAGADLRDPGYGDYVFVLREPK